MGSNRFKKNHPEIDPNDPALLITSGIQEVKEKEETVIEKDKKVNPLDGLIENKPEGKSYGFYLSNEAVSKLEKLAKQNKCSKSKALDMLLKNIL